MPKAHFLKRLTKRTDTARAGLRCFVGEHREALGGRLCDATRHQAGRVETRVASTRSVSPHDRSMNAIEALTRRDSFKKVLKFIRQ